MRPLTRAFRFAISFVAIVVGLSVGCQPKDRPIPPNGTDRKDDADVNELLRLGESTSAAIDEDPEVAGYFKGQGWHLYRDIRISDRKQLVYLSVENRDKPTETVTVTDEGYKMIAKARTVKVLDLRKIKCTDVGLKTIATSTRLEGIILNGEEVSDAGIKALTECKTLDSVYLFDTKKVTDAGVKELAALPKLQTLYLAFFTLDGSAFQPFAGSKTLTTLTLDYIDGFTDLGALHITKIPGLNELKIHKGFGETKITAAGIRAIVNARLPAKFDFDKSLIDDALLESLVAKGWLYGPTAPGATDKKPATPEDVKTIVLDDSKVTDNGFAVLLNCTNVNSLFLQRTAITDETLKKLAGFKRLDYLLLEKTKIGAAGLDAISGLPIKHLSLDGCELSEDAFRALGKMTSLEKLYLSGAQMKGEWLKHISALPKLKELTMMRVEFDDTSVKHVTGLPNLEELVVNSTNIGDVGFLELLQQPKLQKIHVDGTKVTKAVYQKAKKDFPKRTLYFYSYDS